MKRSIHISHQDDEGKWIYRVTETTTVTKLVKEITEDEYKQAIQEVNVFNGENSDHERIKRLLKNAANRTKEEAQDILYRTGVTYSNGRPRQYDEDGQLIPLSKLENEEK